MEKIIEIPEGYEARIKGNKVILELKEGEDERIRKELVEYFINTGCNSIRGVPIENVIAYLEKQKDKRKIGFAEGKVEGVRQTYQEIKEAMSLYEPKDLTPFESTLREYIDSAICFCLSGEGYQQHIKGWAADLLNLEKQKEQKPAEVNIKALLTADRLASAEMTGRLKERSEIIGNPEKYGLQKPLEWSEEDEKMRNNLIEFLIRLSANTRTDSTSINYSYPREIAWLKSLRPQSHWRPSEEQMAALYVAIGISGQAVTLQSLYNDLKKLL